MTPTPPRALALLLTQIDDLPPGRALLGGAALGAGAVGGLLALDHAAATGLALGVVGAGLALTRTGAPRWVARPVPAAPMGPRTVQDPVLGPMVQIPQNAFWMGSPDGEGRDNEHPRHEVRLSPYTIGATVVTQGQWAAVMGGPAPADPQRPRVDVSWADALRFCNAASARAGLRPCYREAAEGWTWDRAADGYRLPTEAEWECAARAGTDTRWSCGDDEGALAEVAWFGEPGRPDGTHPVAQKLPNPWGLYDVHGNVWEWCWDGYDAEFYVRAEATNPVNNSGNGRVVRGGAFFNSASWARSAGRGRVNPGNGDGILGLRCVRSPLPQHS